MSAGFDVDRFLASLGPEFDDPGEDRFGGGNAVCHCLAPVVWGYDGNPRHHRGMCEHCDSVRCDAYPGECGR
ncbi:hypothetical protein [Aeromicrobium sp.]|uniref:hypothetical protein n=1 Tax=Aeromicrobium sp. TaxID=1871063 RepID=UPI002FCC6DB0